MSKKNKCVGLDCEMCGNTKCPNEEKEPIINGIDVSESVLTAANNDVYYSQKAVDELQNTIKRLQEEDEGLKSLNDFNIQKIEVLQEENEKLYKALEKIRKEYTNSIFYQCDKIEEECPCHNCIILGQLDRVQNIVKIIDEVLNDRN